MNLYVANIAPAVNPAELQQLFYGVGQILYARLSDDTNQNDRGYAFVHVPDEASARRAAASLHGTLLKGEPISVHPMSEGTGVIRSKH